MEEIGVAETRAHVTALNERLIGGVDELGGVVVTPRDPEQRGALVCIRSTDAPQLVAALGEEGIVTSERDGNLRISAHAYNTEEDIDAVLAGARPPPESDPNLIAGEAGNQVRAFSTTWQLETRESGFAARIRFACRRFRLASGAPDIL